MQVTFTRLIVIVLLGVCLWAVLIGVAVAVFAPNGFPGVVVAVAGGLGAAACWEWLLGRGT